MFQQLIRTSIIAAAVLLFSGWQPCSASAGDWHGSYFSFYRGLGPNVYSSGQLPVPPYFSIHPPVYYGLHMVRHYGYNPFTCPCTPPIVHHRHPAYLELEAEQSAEEVAPVRVTNHFAQEGAVAQSVPTNAAQPQPLRLLNPYVTAEVAQR